MKSSPVTQSPDLQICLDLIPSFTHVLCNMAALAHQINNSEHYGQSISKQHCQNIFFEKESTE